MKRLRQRWQNIRYSLWFIPSLIVALSILLAVASIVADVWVQAADLPDWPRLFSGSADGARGTLEVIASAMITIAALSFSITILVLSSVASQYTPRIIRTFMSNGMTKTVLGVFVGVYLYCLIVLRTVNGNPPEFVPAVGVTLALVLAVVGVGFLIAFIHHIASSIQVSTIVARLGADTEEAIDQLFPQRVDQCGVEPAPDAGDETGQRDWHALPANLTGYIQSIAMHDLARFAGEQNMLIRMEKTVGEFVMRGEPLAYAGIAQDDKQLEQVNDYFAIGAHRTVEQDVGVGIRQLADIALRAISPASNDTTTASMCLDYLTTILVRLAPRRLVSGSDSWNGERRLIVRCTDFKAFLRLAFEQLRQQANGDKAVYLRLLDALHTVAQASTHPSRLVVVEREAKLVARYARDFLHHADQQADIEQALQRVLSALHR